MKIETLRHSLSHIMAAAVQELYPGTKFGIGPAIEDGFYYDFEFPKTIGPDELPKIEKRMRELIRQNIVFKKKNVTKKEALTLFKNQPYKIELINELEGKEITIYESGSFVDLCAGPHIKSSKEIPIDAFKLISIAGAYWRGSEKNQMLTRIYGIAFETKKEMEGYLKNKEEAEKRDHRIIGQKLELFTFDDEVGQGLPLWMPKGALLRKLIIDFAIDTYLENGYELVSTPHMASGKLWSHSGHVDFYKENLYDEFGIEEEMYRLKPMNCPLHVAIYKTKPHSYKELPLRWTEMGTVYRYERSGTLHGLTRVRGFTQDDAHIICTPEQLHQELVKAFKLTLYILKTFGFKDFEPNLSTRDLKNKGKFIGSDKDWKIAETELKNVLIENGYGDKYVEDVGGAVFYGPKIDIKIKDAIGRKWQLSTIQFDFNLPSRFQMSYIDIDGKEHTPFMIHRALLGSLERFIGVLLEHYAGALPVWLSPVQVWVLPISTKHEKYAQKITKELKESGIRVDLKNENETVGKKIRNGEMQKIPYILVVGDKEMKSKTVSVRQRNKGDIGESSLPSLIKKLKLEIEKKK
ncbi:MAG: threonine--tRNA ligase [Candidatus Parcubacteria bacterium]|nr:threonine--tRNA ligase [Candidatus Parcubacteria bacterium]